MTRVALAAAIAALLMGAVAVGWIGCWLWMLAHRRKGTETDRLARLAAELHAAEAAAQAADDRARAAEAEVARLRAAAGQD